MALPSSMKLFSVYIDSFANMVQAMMIQQFIMCMVPTKARKELLLLAEQRTAITVSSASNSIAIYTRFSFYNIFLYKGW